MKFLTPDLKNKYMDDFKNNLLTCNDSFWKLDDRLVEILKRINSNYNIQTLFSKWWAFPPNSNENISYLRFCYSFELIQIIKTEVIENLKSDFSNLPDVNLECKFMKPEPPQNDEDNVEEVVCNLACLKDPQYFNINYISFTLHSPMREHHKMFWERLDKYFLGILTVKIKD